MTARMVSGYGQHHTNEPGAKRPEPYVTIDWAGVQALVDSPQQVPKGEAQWLIPSTLPTRSFLSQEREGQFWILWADFDVDPQGVHAVEAALVINVIGEAQFEAYTSSSSTTDKPKCRAMIPLSQPLSGAEWVLAQQALNDMLSSSGLAPDRVSERTGQLCYLPNRGALYEARSQRTGPLFDPMLAWAKEIASKRQVLADAAAALEATRKAAAERNATRAAQPNPKGRSGLIDAFNEAYTVNDILLQAGYSQRGNTFCHPNSESGSYSASVKDGRGHSLSNSDPLHTGGAGGGAHDAFGALRGADAQRQP